MDSPNYKESNIIGTKWQRVCRVVIENPLNASPSVLFVEEEVFNTGDKIITNLVDNILVEFNPEDLNHVDIYTKLNDVYTTKRVERDNLNQPEVQP